ncbi:interaptin-like [Aphis craccivora]|uniref:Interaptin-like n=1 Tax=Aphis craccivora TaxID=307492 RepID=A0A6G0ZQA8_APHCR|nr:interaptin-like [Aphis craccivora]
MCEDEWSDVEKRFEKEGIDYSRLKTEEKLIHVWRWLVDADINLQNARKMIEKLRLKQNEELEDMENYMVHVRVLADKRIDDMEKTMSIFAEQVARLECELNNLDSIDGDNVCDKVSNLIHGYTSLVNEVNVLKRVRSFDVNGICKESDDVLMIEMIKISAEKESLKRQVKELEDRLSIYEMAKTEYNTQLISMELSESSNKIDGKDSLLDNSISWNRNITNDDTSSISIQLFSDRTKSANHFCNDFTQEEKSDNQKPNVNEITRTFGPESTPPSLLSSELATPRQISTILTDEMLNNQSDELKKIKAELDVHKTLVSSLGEKYNALALKHLQYKSKRKMQIEALKGNLEASQCQMESLKTQLSIQKRRFKTEEEFRKQVETDYRSLQEEKRNIDFRIAMSENELRNMARHLNVLHKKVAMLESANADLLSKHLQLVYKNSHIPKSTTCDCILTAMSDDK